MRRCLLLLTIHAATALHLSRGQLPARALLPTYPLRAHPRCAADTNGNSEPSDEELQKSLRDRQEASKLDLPDQSDDLAAAFNKRLEKEGGSTAFRLKTDASRAAEGVQEGAQKVKEVGQNAVDSAGSWASSLPPNTLRLVAIILFLSFFPSIISAIAGGGATGGSNEFYTPTYGQI